MTKAEERCTDAKAIIEEAAQRASEEEGLDATKAAIRAALEPLETCKPAVRVDVIPDEDHIPIRNRTDDYFGEDDPWASWEEYAAEMGERLTRQVAAGSPIPRPGEFIMDPVDSVFVTDIFHDPTEAPPRVVLRVGLQSEPVQAPTEGERRIPEQIPVGGGRTTRTAWALEDMDYEAQQMRAQVHLMRTVLREYTESGGGTFLQAYEIRDLLNSIEGELEVMRSRFGAMLRGYFGDDYEQF